jgi:CBS domain-containing protein
VVEKVTENTTAIVAFTSMIQKQVRGLAVVDQNGKLVDSLSDRDLRVGMEKGGKTV